MLKVSCCYEAPWHYLEATDERICWLNMPSLKRLGAQGCSISHRQPNNEELDRDVGEKAFGERMGFLEKHGGEDVHVSLNLRNILSPLTKHSTRGGKLLSPRGDSHAFWPDRHPYLTHRTYRPLPGHRASSTEDLAKDAGEALILVHLTQPDGVLLPDWSAVALVWEMEGRGEEGRKFKWWRKSNEHRRLSGNPQICDFLPPVLHVSNVNYRDWSKRTPPNMSLWRVIELKCSFVPKCM